MLLSIIFSALLLGAVKAAPRQEGDRIVGGSDAKLGEWPYIISLKKPISHSCGGSILNESYVMTAAHCIYGSENAPETLRVQYGVVDITSPANIVNVSKVIRHENYSPGGQYANDIAVLKLAQPIKLGPYAQPVQLPESNEYPGDNATATLIGWGLDGVSSGVRDHLQKVQIVLFDNKFCKSKEYNYNSNVHVCAGIPEGGKGQCNGDSGGPLTVAGKQYGIVSWSVKPCSSKGHPGIFAKVTQYRDWIRRQTGI